MKPIECKQVTLRTGGIGTNYDTELYQSSGQSLHWTITGVLVTRHDRRTQTMIPFTDVESALLAERLELPTEEQPKPKVAATKR